MTVSGFFGAARSEKLEGPREKPERRTWGCIKNRHIWRSL